MTDTKPRMQWQDITPELSGRLLEGNVINRPIRQWKVDQLARDMANGRFQATHQGIALSAPGATIDGKTYAAPVVIDGQHRLWAILQSGVTIRIPVFYNMPVETQSVIDDHERRTVAHQYSLETGRPISTLMVAIANMMHRRGQHNRRSVIKLSRREQMDVVRTYWDGVAFVMDAIHNSTMRFITCAPVLAECARASYTHDHDTVRAFIAGLVTGENLTKGSPVLALRNQLLAQGQGLRVVGTRLHRDDVSDRTAIALNAYLRGEQIRTLKTRSQDNVPRFPVPGDAYDVTSKKRRRRA